MFNSAFRIHSYWWPRRERTTRTTVLFHVLLGGRNQWSVPVFFFTRENEKCPRKRFLALFLVFFAGRIFYSRPLFLKFSRPVWSFLVHFLVYFLGMTFFFLGQKFENFLGQFYFFWAEIIYGLNVVLRLFFLQNSHDNFDFPKSNSKIRRVTLSDIYFYPRKGGGCRGSLPFVIHIYFSVSTFFILTSFSQKDTRR